MEAVPKENVVDKAKYGGPRRMLCWEEKLQCLQHNVIVDFIANATCDCERDCGGKIKKLQATEAVSILRGLRTERLAGDS